MYIITILLICATSFIAGPLAIINAFRHGDIALAIIRIITVLLFAIAAFTIFEIRGIRGDFELSPCDEDNETSHKLKNLCGYSFGFAIVLLIITWFCQLAGII